MHFISKNMNSYKQCLFSALFFVSLVSFPTFGRPTLNQKIPDGSYQESCSEIRWISHSDLEAKCKDNNSVLSEQYTKILNAPYHLLNGNVTNANGNLVAPGIATPRGSWTQSCKWSTYNFSTQKLRAMCQSANRNWFWSDVRASPKQEVENRDGHLVLR